MQLYRGGLASGGSFFGRSGHMQPFVVSERNGTWGPATEVPGSRALDAGRNAYVASVSCGGPGDCAADGAYSDGRLAHAFVVTEHNGTWSRARAVIGP
jgi:hypothetical protein